MTGDVSTEAKELANILQEYYEKVVPPENQKSNEDLVKLAEKVTSGDEGSRERLFSALEKKYGISPLSAIGKENNYTSSNTDSVEIVQSENHIDQSDQCTIFKYAPGSETVKNAIKSYLKKERVEIWSLPYTEERSGLPNENAMIILGKKILTEINTNIDSVDLDICLYELNIFRIALVEKSAKKQGSDLSNEFMDHKLASFRRSHNKSIDVPGSQELKSCVKNFLKNARRAIWNPPYSLEDGLPNVDKLRDLAKEMLSSLSLPEPLESYMFELEMMRIKSYERFLSKKAQEPSINFLEYKKIMDENFSPKEITPSEEARNIAEVLNVYYQKVLPVNLQKNSDEILQLAVQATERPEGKKKLFDALNKKYNLNPEDFQKEKQIVYEKTDMLQKEIHEEINEPEQEMYEEINEPEQEMYEEINEPEQEMYEEINDASTNRFLSVDFHRDTKENTSAVKRIKTFPLQSDEELYETPRVERAENKNILNDTKAYGKIEASDMRKIDDIYSDSGLVGEYGTQEMLKLSMSIVNDAEKEKEREKQILEKREKLKELQKMQKLQNLEKEKRRKEKVEQEHRKIREAFEARKKEQDELDSTRQAMRERDRLKSYEEKKKEEEQMVKIREEQKAVEKITVLKANIAEEAYLFGLKLYFKFDKLCQDESLIGPITYKEALQRIRLSTDEGSSFLGSKTYNQIVHIVEKRKDFGSTDAFFDSLKVRYGIDPRPFVYAHVKGLSPENGLVLDEKSISGGLTKRSYPTLFDKNKKASETRSKKGVETNTTPSKVTLIRQEKYDENIATIKKINEELSGISLSNRVEYLRIEKLEVTRDNCSPAIYTYLEQLLSTKFRYHEEIFGDELKYFEKDSSGNIERLKQLSNELNIVLEKSLEDLQSIVTPVPIIIKPISVPSTLSSSLNKVKLLARKQELLVKKYSSIRRIAPLCSPLNETSSTLAKRMATEENITENRIANLKENWFNEVKRGTRDSSSIDRMQNIKSEYDELLKEHSIQGEAAFLPFESKSHSKLFESKCTDRDENQQDIKNEQHDLSLLLKARKGDDIGNTALHIAALNGDHKTVEWLLDESLRVEFTDLTSLKNFKGQNVRQYLINNHIHDKGYKYKIENEFPQHSLNDGSEGEIYSASGLNLNSSNKSLCESPVIGNSFSTQQNLREQTYCESGLIKTNIIGETSESTSENTEKISEEKKDDRIQIEQIIEIYEEKVRNSKSIALEDQAKKNTVTEIQALETDILNMTKPGNEKDEAVIKKFALDEALFQDFLRKLERYSKEMKF
eukprot:UC4_evm5s805